MPAVAVAWRGTTENRTLAPAAIQGDRIIVAGEATAEAWSPDGARAWTSPLAMPANFAPRPAPEHVVIGGRKGLSVLEMADGSTAWRATPTEAFGAPLVHGNRLLVGDGSDLAAFALADGAPLWRYTVHGSAGIFYAPAARGGTLFLGAGDGHLTALDADSGAVRWSIDRFGQWQYLRQMALTADGGVLVAGGYDDAVYGLNPTDGAILWRFEAGNFINSQLVHEGGVYFWSPTGWVIGLDARTGDRRWRTRTHRFGSDGRADWAPIMAEVRASGPWLWVLDMGHRLHVLDRANGREAAAPDLPFRARPFVTPTADPDRLVFGTVEGDVVMARVSGLPTETGR
ncbi:PQQ-binding-like beta-propeller repeat protein [Rhodospira trueperi]|uniref:PQQ-like domain-containing protein n=1 Tax=Rhodospira trueperi TaxID=69960 RepID=A0A1G7GXS4_9PROT|nr:PQQ-binding-like beta-propeller repeat protein [Rhodospira trueperi]SDE92972.1 PQQ-like domain-containing protein [Rhodospira trueperi]